jgi:hypothetical protein
LKSIADIPSDHSGQLAITVGDGEGFTDALGVGVTIADADGEEEGEGEGDVVGVVSGVGEHAVSERRSNAAMVEMGRAIDIIPPERKRYSLETRFARAPRSSTEKGDAPRPHEAKGRRPTVKHRSTDDYDPEQCS